MPALAHSRTDSQAPSSTPTLGDHLRALAKTDDTESKPALVVQGGGLRGVYSMGALTVLEEHGLRDAFSLVIGSSAGAINSAYFLSGQACESLSIYYEELASRRFFSPLRPWQMVNVDYLVDEVLKVRHPLDVGEMRRAKATLKIVLTDAETARSKVFTDPAPEIDIYELFRATAALPGLYNRRVEIAGRNYIDGGVADLVPLRHALARSDEAVVLLTRGAEHRVSERGVLFRTLVRALSHGQSRLVREKICSADLSYNMAMDMLDGELRKLPRKTWTLRPSNLERLVNRTTNDSARLRDCAELGRSDMEILLSQERRLVPTRA